MFAGSYPNMLNNRTCIIALKEKKRFEVVTYVREITIWDKLLKIHPKVNKLASWGRKHRQCNTNNVVNI